MKLCKSHITQLSKVETALSYNQTMNYGQLLLSQKNFAKIHKAKEHIREAMEILKTVE